LGDFLNSHFTANLPKKSSSEKIANQLRIMAMSLGGLVFWLTLYTWEDINSESTATSKII